jgi:NAD(P)-dependent dehydrogenase (short-subunit alcohol dehydrogenase family)
VTPGQVATPKQEELFDEETKAQFGSLIPRGKMGSSEEIASVALFLAPKSVVVSPVCDIQRPRRFSDLPNLSSRIRL